MPRRTKRRKTFGLVEDGSDCVKTRVHIPCIRSDSLNSGITYPLYGCALPTPFSVGPSGESDSVLKRDRTSQPGDWPIPAMAMRVVDMCYASFLGLCIKWNRTTPIIVNGYVVTLPASLHDRTSVLQRLCEADHLV